MPLNVELVIKVFKETFQSDEHVRRLVQPPFKGKYGYTEPFRLLVIETENISIRESLHGREPRSNRCTEWKRHNQERWDFIIRSFLEMLLS